MKTLFTTPAQALAATAPKAAFIIRTALLAGFAVLGSLGAAMAHGGPSVKAKQADGKSLAFTVENPDQQKVQVRVMSLNTKRDIMNEVNRQSSYGCKLNFEGMPTGTYAVMLRVGDQSYRYTVQVQAASQTTISVPELVDSQGTQGVASASL
jgi:hypothetical protein